MKLSIEWKNGVVKRILIIDDEPSILLLLRTILERQEYEVVEALNGEEGMRLFHENRFDLVITDMVMPAKDGLKTIMELMEETPDLPVIAISGGGAIPKERYLTIASYLGNVRTIPKPFSREVIIETVNELIGDNENNELS